jgi:hypothetical protein
VYKLQEEKKKRRKQGNKETRDEITNKRKNKVFYSILEMIYIWPFSLVRAPQAF